MAKFRTTAKFCPRQSLSLLGYMYPWTFPTTTLAFFMCSLDWNIPGTWFDIYAVTGTASNSFAINRSGIPGVFFDLGALPGAILSLFLLA